MKQWQQEASQHPGMSDMMQEWNKVWEEEHGQIGQQFIQ